MPQPRKSSKRIEAEIRRGKAIELKIAGGTDRQIAQALGISPGQANKDIKRFLADQVKAMNADGAIDEYRALLTSRYEESIRMLIPRMIYQETVVTKREDGSEASVTRTRYDWNAWTQWHKSMESISKIWGMTQMASAILGSKENPLQVSIVELAKELSQREAQDGIFDVDFNDLDELAEGQIKLNGGNKKDAGDSNTED